MSIGAYAVDLVLIAPGDAVSASDFQTVTGPCGDGTAGTAVASPTPNTSNKVEGTAALPTAQGATTKINTTTLNGFYFTGTLDFSGTDVHIFSWREILTPSLCDTRANGGLRFQLVSETTYSATAYPGVGYREWFLEGSDTNFTGGWKQTVIDPKTSPKSGQGREGVTSLSTLAYQPSSISISGTSKTFTRASGSFTVDGFAVGMAITCSNSANTGVYIISAVTATVITCATVGPATTEAAATRYISRAQINTGLTSIAVNSTSKTFTRTVGSFLTDGFAVGMMINCGPSANTGNYIISAVTDLVITCATTGPATTETASNRWISTGFNPARVRFVAALTQLVMPATTFTNNATYHDVMRYGTGFSSITLGTVGTPITFSDMWSVDSTLTNAWGLITSQNGVWFLHGKFRFGTASQTAVTVFTDTGQVCVFPNWPVSPTLYEFNLVGAASFQTTVTLGAYSSGLASQGCTIKGAGKTTGTDHSCWNITVGANAILNLYACVLSELRRATLTSLCAVRSCTISNSGDITTSGATIDDTLFTGLKTTAPILGTALITLNAPSDAAAITNCTFTQSAVAIKITAAGTYTFNNWKFTGNTVDIQNTSNGAVIINCTNGSNPSTSSNTGGGTVTINNAVNLVLQNVVVGSRYTILESIASPAKTTLAAPSLDGVSAVTSLNLTDASAFPTSGCAIINNECFTYTGKSTNTLTGVTRAANGTSMAAHSIGAVVIYANIIAYGTAATSTITIPYNYLGDKQVTIRVRTASTSPKYVNFETGGTITSTGLNSYISQVKDTIVS